MLVKTLEECKKDSTTSATTCASDELLLQLPLTGWWYWSHTHHNENMHYACQCGFWGVWTSLGRTMETNLFFLTFSISVRKEKTYKSPLIRALSEEVLCRM